ncbi:murein biosynthesis integral membrane protein MurJ, partial [Clostridium chrysemydis]|uniref:murein biosynthesis integral membrane protein MurJ n=1 Tax=Clostridium chrysemydis TaxID=2665504 RepID=UPI003F312D37
LRDYLMAIKFGTSLEADAYMMASNIPNVLFIVLGTAIMTIMIPVYNEIKAKKSRNELNKFVSNTLSILLILSIFLTLVCEIMAPIIVRVMAVGFTGYKFTLTVLLTRILASVIILNTIIYIFNAVLQCENNFILPASIGIPYNMFLIIYFIFFSEKYGVIGISVIISFALIGQVIMLLKGIKKIGFKYIFMVNLKDKELIRMVRLLPPVCIGTGMNQINGIFNGIFASQLDGGSVSALNYALKLSALITDVIIGTIITIVYQNISKTIADGDSSNNLNERINTSIVLMFIVLIPVVIFALGYCEYIVKFLFQRGAFSIESTILTASAFKGYCFGLFAIAINYILSRVCYALGDTKTPMVNTLISLTLNVLFSWILINKFQMGLYGISIASALGSWISVVILYINVNKKIKGCISLNTIKKLSRLLFATLPFALLIYYSKETFIQINSSQTIKQLINMASVFAVGVFIYLLLGYFMKIKEIREIFQFKRIEG